MTKEVAIHLTHVEEHAEEGLDPYLPYHNVEDTLINELPSSTALNTLADFISLAPYKRLKGTSNHGQDPDDPSQVVMYQYSSTEIVHKHAEKYAHAVVRGEDFANETHTYTEAARLILDKNNVTLEDLANQDGHVLDNLRQAIPDFNTLESPEPWLATRTSQLQLTLINLVLAQKMRITAAEQGPQSSSITTVEQNRIQERAGALPFTIELHKSIFEELKQPEIPENTLRLFAFLFERYALHMPLKVTMDGQQLGLGGIIHGMLEKIAEGIINGEDLQSRSAHALEITSKRPDIVTMAQIPAAYRQIGDLARGELNELKTSLPNFILLNRIKDELSHRSLPKEKIQKSFYDLIRNDLANEWNSNP